jgi:hypothetical protein
MKREIKFAVLTLLVAGLVGCGPNLTGNFVGTQQRLNGGFMQQYQANLQLIQNGDQVSGSVISTPSQTQSGGQGGFVGSFVPVTGQIRGQVNGNFLQNIQMTSFENGCQVTYSGNLTIVNGNRLQGMLYTLPTTSTSSTTTTCASSFGTSTSQFDVSK